MAKRGRPSQGILKKGVATHVSADLPPALKEKLNAFSAATYIPVAAIVRLAIAEYLDNHKDQMP
jgi:predicted DNA-binding protein